MREIVARLRRARPAPLLDQAVATRQLAVMLNSGVALSRALEVLGRQDSSPRLAAAWEDVHREVLKGGTLSRGMARNTDVFGMLYIGLTRAGEMSGALAKVLAHLATLMEREVRLRARVGAALTYPALIFALCMGVAFFLVQHILPTFMNGVLMGMDDLPWMTRVLVFVTEAMKNPYLLGVGAVTLVVGGFLAQQHLATPHGRYQRQRLLLDAPVLGGVARRLLYARFCRTLATMLLSGTTVVSALQITSSALANFPLAEAVDGIVKDLKDGRSLAEAFHDVAFFPSMVNRLVAVGEEAGDLVTILERLAEFYEQELDLALETLTAALEPILVAVMGGFVGFVLVALFLPLYQLLTTL